MDSANGPVPAPKISGLSTPVGSSTKKKQESPAQRTEAINQNNAAPMPAKTEGDTRAQAQQKRVVTTDEIHEYRKKRAKSRTKKTIITILIILALCAIGYYVYKQVIQKTYNINSSIYNDALPIVVQNGDKSFLINQKGNKLSSEYSFISNYTSKTTLAMSYTGEKYNYYILDMNGKELLSSENQIDKINKGENYLLRDGSNTYLLDANGKQVSDMALVNPELGSYEYMLVQDESKIAIITKHGETKYSRTVENFEVTDFSYAKNTYDDNYYCAIQYRTATENQVTVYNCETAKEVKKINNAGIYADFYDSETPLLISDNYYYFYNEDLLFESEYPSIVKLGGIIETTNEEGETLYFDPKTKDTQAEYPTHSLIQQNKLDTTTEITESCTDYEKSVTQNIIKICGKIYYDNKLQKLDYDGYYYELLPEELARYLSYLGKNYILKIAYSTGSKSLFDVENGAVVEGLENITTYFYDENNSSFIQVRSDNENRKYYNIITGESIEIENSIAPTFGTNSLSYEKDGIVYYYNKNGKQIYKLTKGE